MDWRRAEEILRKVPAVAWVVVLALLVRVVYGGGHLGYDAAYSLVWGDELVSGDLPDYEVPFAPTPHPLMNVLAMPLAPLGDGASKVLEALTLASLAALAVIGARLGATLFGPIAGVILAVLVLTRPSLISGTLFASSDIPFLALVAGAVLAEARRPQNAWTVLLLLGLAGLIRPEAWLLSGTYALVLAATTTRDRRRQATLLVAGAAPALLWALSDLLITGDPLHSLHGTRELAETLARPRGGSDATTLLPYYLQRVAGDAIAVAGVVAAVVFLWRRPASVQTPLAVLGIGIAFFLVLGLAGLPLLTRYAVLPALVLMLFTAGGLTAWRDEGPPIRTGWLVAAGATVVWILAGVPDTVERLDRFRDSDRERRTAQASLRRLVDASGLSARTQRCGPLVAPTYRLVPLLALELDAPARSIDLITDTEAAPTEGHVIVPASSLAGGSIVSRTDTAPPLLEPPEGFTRIPSGQPDWALFARC